MYRKAEARIAQYAQSLEESAYADVTGKRIGPWSYGVRKEDGDDAVPRLETKPVQFPFSYGKGWTNWWFFSSLDLRGLEGEVFLRLETETDSMIYLDGRPEGAVNPFHRLFRLAPYLGGRHAIAVEAWDGHFWPGYHPFEKGRVLTSVAVRKDSYPLVFSRPSLVLRDAEVFSLAYDVKTLLSVSRLMGSGTYACQHLLGTLHSALMGIDLFPADRGVWKDQIRKAKKEIRPLLEAKNGTFAPQVLSVGNAHLDNAWLWPEKETARKAARTCLNMAAFGRRYPSFRYLFTQPAQIEAVKERYPSVYEKVLGAYRAGFWEPNGVTYVEPDGNLPSGESLIRQCLWGKRANRELFDGYEGDTCWLPDSFGYSAILPTVLKGCGVKYFVTSKLSWNDTTRFPYDVFRWQGLDGSEVCCAMIQGAYEGTNEPADVAGAYAKVQDKSIQPVLFRPVGEGDGGGGTMESDLEYMEREKDLQGMPRNRWCTLSKAMQTVFRNKEKLPSYRGELYLELHRGTYTGQARTKRYNRVLESMLHSAEYVIADRFVRGKDVREDLAVLDRVWKRVLINQFHDVLPGSSIREVYEDAEKSYQEAVGELEKLLPGGKGRILNTSPFSRTLPDGRTVSPYATASPIAGEKGKPTRKKAFPTAWGKVAVDGDGRIPSLVFKGRETAWSDRPMNSLVFGEDCPIRWDAWDIEPDSLAKCAWIGHPEKSEREETPSSFKVRLFFRVGAESEISQTVTVYKHIPRIDFATHASWHEKHRILRVEFPSRLKADDAYFDSSFGYIRRSLHHDYPEEKARFEMPAHMWAALRDEKIALGLASDCKYGYGADGDTLSLSLLRSSRAPDPEADQGEHDFTYSWILSDAGLGKIMAEAEALNIPLAGAEGDEAPLCTVAGDGSVVVETVKVAENRRGVVFRLRETEGIPAAAELHFREGLDAAGLVETDMLENPEGKRPDLSFGPFQVKTFFVPLSR